MHSTPKKIRRDHAWYALRRTLPVWSFEENLKELVEYLPRCGVNEIWVKIDTEDFSHGQVPLEWARRYQECLFKIKEAMDGIGVLYSLNPWITTGMTDRGRNAHDLLPGLKTTVSNKGTKMNVWACPYSEVWRDHTDKLWTLYAQTRPHVIWLEDDIRTFEYEAQEFTCFCPEHMKRFSQRVGQKVTRQELAAAIIKPGKPHRWRKVFLDMQAEGRNDLAGFLAGIVHRTSPETSLGLMSSPPRAHCLEGRRWGEFCEALADGQAFYCRPSLANYWEGTMRGFYHTQDSIKLTRHCLPAGTSEQAEVENAPMTRYADSATYTFLKMAISFAMGCEAVALNLYDHCGTPMETEGAFGRMMSKKKPFLEALAKYSQQPGRYRGVQILHHDKAAYHKRLDKTSVHKDLTEDGYFTVPMLESHGISTIYDDAEVVATSGQVLEAYSDSEIRQILSRGLLLDGSAAYVLFRRGFGKEIGLKFIDKPKNMYTLQGVYAAEELFNKKFGGADKKFMTMVYRDREPVSFALLHPVKTAEIISRVVDADARRHTVCMYAYENKCGGRVAVHAVDLASAYCESFNHPFRAESLQKVVRWLGRGQVPVFARGEGVYPWVLRKDFGEETLLGFFNLTLDAWRFVELELSEKRSVDRLQVLSQAGRWKTDSALAAGKSAGRYTVRYDKPVPYDAPLFVRVRWKQTFG